MNKAIVICYTGRQIRETERVAIENIISEACDTTQNLIITTRFDENDIAKALLKKSAEDIKISFVEDSHEQKPTTDTICITFNPKTCEQKIRIVKCIKESLNCSLKEAKDMFDCGRVYIPRSWNDPKIYAFIRDIHNLHVTITGGIEDYTMMQAAIFLNETYGAKDSIALVKDFAAATYHSHTNSADEEEQALLTAVELVKTYPASANRWVYPGLINAIDLL